MKEQAAAAHDRPPLPQRLHLARRARLLLRLQPRLQLLLGERLLLHHDLVLVNDAELPRPLCIVEEGAQVEAVVLRAVVLRVVGGRQRGALVPVDGVADEEVLALARHLGGRQRGPGGAQLMVHGDGAAALDLAQPAVAAQLLVRHAHVHLVQLRQQRARRGVDGAGLQLGGGAGRHHAAQRGPAVALRRVQQEALQVALGDAADRVDVGAAAVVLGQVAAQRLVHVGRAQHEQEAAAAAGAGSSAAAGAALARAQRGQQLRQQVRDDHAQSRLHILQREVLGGGAAARAEARRKAARERGKDGDDGGDGGVDARLQVVGAHVRRHGARARARFGGGQLRRHVAGVQQPPRHLARARRRPALVALAQHGAQVAQHGAVARRHGGVHQLRHDADDRGRRGRVGAAGERQEEAAGAGAPQKVPQVAGGPQRNLLLWRQVDDGPRRRGAAAQQRGRRRLVRGSRAARGGGGDRGGSREAARRAGSTQQVGARRVARQRDAGGGGGGGGGGILCARGRRRRARARARRRAEVQRHGDARQRRRGGGLRAPAHDGGARGAHVCQVDGGGDDLDIGERELRALRDALAIDKDERRAVKVQPAAVAALLVGVQVGAAVARRRAAHQVDAHVQLAQLVVAAAAVGDNVGAGERERRVRRAGREQLLAALARQHGVGRRQQRHAKGRGALAARQRRDAGRQRALLQRPRRAPVKGPGREPAALAVAAVVRQRQLRPDQQDRAAQAPDAAVVAHAAVQQRHAKVAQEPIGRAVAQQPRQRLPAVRHRVGLVEVVLAAVAAQLQLRPQPVARASRLGLRAARAHARIVAREIQRVLVQRARRQDRRLHRGGVRTSFRAHTHSETSGEERRTWAQRTKWRDYCSEQSTHSARAGGQASGTDGWAGGG